MTLHLIKQCAVSLCPQVSRTFHSSSELYKVVQYKLSDIGEGIREVTVKGWCVKPEDTVAQFDDICEVESDKATVTITSRYDGRVTKLYHAVGDIALVGHPLVDIDVEEAEGMPEPTQEVDKAVPEEDVKVVKEASVAEGDETWNKSLATPAVRRIAMENKVSIKDVRGSGKHGRVMKEDILEYLKNKHHQLPVGKSQDRTEPMSTLQKVMTKTMTKSQSIPSFLYCDEVDMSKLVQLKKEIKPYLEKKGIKMSYLPFILKALSMSLLEYPILNSTVDESSQTIIYKGVHNIGIAVDSPSGLLVPNIKNVQNLSILQIAKEASRLQEVAIKGNISPGDLAGGTFTVSNVGSVGGTYARPMILPPEVSIVALGKIQTLPRYDHLGNLYPANTLNASHSADHRIIDGPGTYARPRILPPEVSIVALGKIQTLPRYDHLGNLYPANTLNASHSADHRIIDGATVARFTNLWKSYVENPTLLMLGL
uniref:Dihydrolipoamide acetyltransferase component of pyruvate dehydrogenase complex n=1 Tax=Clastoptera arizonana TaxID=38151 RepID=A0A1B6EFV7_9HEMI